LKNVFTGLLVLLCLGLGPAQAQTEDTVSVTARYQVSITDMSFLKSSLVFLGRIFGIVPKELQYREASVVQGCGSDAFQMVLGNSSRQWLEVFSDTARFSFIDPPAFPLQSLKRYPAFGRHPLRFRHSGFLRSGLRGRFLRPFRALERYDRFQRHAGPVSAFAVLDLKPEPKGETVH